MDVFMYLIAHLSVHEKKKEKWRYKSQHFINSYQHDY
jgi:hypothetical protein